MTRIIVQALEKTGQRGIINRGWGGLGNCESSMPSVYFVFHCSDCEACSDFCFSVAGLNKSVYLLDNCPHDWLFPRCTAVVPAKFFLVEVQLFSVKNESWLIVANVSGTSWGCRNNCCWS